MYANDWIANTLSTAYSALVQFTSSEPDFKPDTRSRTANDLSPYQLPDTSSLSELQSFPSPDSQDTYNLSAIIQHQQFSFRPITLRPGQTLVITKKLDYTASEDDSEYHRGRRGRPQSRPRRRSLRSAAKAATADYPSGWFTLVDCGINAAGELEWRFVVDRAKRTPRGRVVIVDVMVEGDELADGADEMRWADSTKYFYQIG